MKAKNIEKQPDLEEILDKDYDWQEEKWGFKKLALKAMREAVELALDEILEDIGGYISDPVDRRDCIDFIEGVKSRIK